MGLEEYDGYVEFVKWYESSPAVEVGRLEIASARRQRQSKSIQIEATLNTHFEQNSRPHSVESVQHLPTIPLRPQLR